MVKSQSSLGNELLNAKLAANPVEQNDNVWDHNNKGVKDTSPTLLESMFST